MPIAKNLGSLSLFVFHGTSSHLEFLRKNLPHFQPSRYLSDFFLKRISI